MHRASLGVLLLLAGCQRGAAPVAATPSRLAGLTLALWPSPLLRLGVEGRLGGEPVPVALDVSHPLSTVSSACFGEELPPPAGVAEVPEPAGGTVRWPLVRVEGLRLGAVELGARRMGLARERSCAVTLGGDVLAPYALTVDPLRREVTFSPSRPRASYAAELGRAGANSSEEVHVLELSRDPVGDWPLLAARVVQGEASLTGAFFLGTREPFSRLALEPARAQGLEPVEEAAGVVRALVAEGVEVAEGVGVQPLVWEARLGWRHPGTLGRLGPDVWGRFGATLDVQGDALVLRRPRVWTEEGRPRCARQEAPESRAEEACFALHVRRAAGRRLAVSAAVYRDLPEGGRLYLEPQDPEGRPLQTACRVGLSFTPTGRGAHAWHLMPWGRMTSSLPECARELGAAQGYALALFEEGALPECPASCAFVYHLPTRRTVCECPQTPLGEAVAPPRRSAPPRPPPPSEREQEPQDPL